MARLCDWCRKPLLDVQTSRRRFCHRACRQAFWRAREVSLMEGRDGQPRRIGYADPPYPELAHYYADQPNYGGEVDHSALIPLLTGYDGWALSTSSKALRALLPLCPPEAEVAAWVKPIGVPRTTRGTHSRWEAVIYVPARRLQPGKPDWLRAMPARLGDSDLIGRKPRAFYLWLFELLGMAPGDGFADLYPGSQMGSRCWRALSLDGSRRVLGDDASLLQLDDATPFYGPAQNLEAQLAAQLPTAAATAGGRR